MSHLIQRATALLLLLAVASLSAFAQEGASVGEKIRQTQALVQSEFRQILRDEMLFTDEESAAFWPLYERYSAEKRAVNERYLASLIEYVDRYYAGDLTDEHASRLMNVYFDVQLESHNMFICRKCLFHANFRLRVIIRDWKQERQGDSHFQGGAFLVEDAPKTGKHRFKIYISLFFAVS